MNFFKKINLPQNLLKTILKKILYFAVGNIKGRTMYRNLTKLEIGHGQNKKHLFVGLDYNLRTDVPYDLKWGLPFKKERFDFIYAEHVFEHFNYSELTGILKECKRVLKPEGTLRIVVPNANLYIKGYLNPQNFNILEMCRYQWGLSYASPLDYLNYIFYMDGHHKYMMDEKILSHLGKELGFSDCYSSSFETDLDSVARAKNSLYYEFKK